jgi:hypothetical protein
MGAQQRRQPPELGHGPRRPGAIDDHGGLLGDGAGWFRLLAGRMGDRQPGQVDRSIALILRWQGRQAVLEGDDGLVWLAQEHGAVGRLHLDEGRRAVAGEDAVLLTLILGGCGLFSRRVKGSGASGWVAGQGVPACFLA